MDNGITPVQALIEEHHFVLAKLEALEDIFQHLDRKEENSARLEELTGFFKTAFWLHFDKEEQALFPEFDNFMPHGAGPLAVMIEEHNVLRDTNDVMQDAVARYLGAGDTPETRKTIKESGMHFIEFLKDHIFKEDKLFPRLAEMHLGTLKNSRVIKIFNEIEKPGIKANNS
jgi:regulator of cell morphogenesis and NO signaling